MKNFSSQPWIRLSLVTAAMLIVVSNGAIAQTRGTDRTGMWAATTFESSAPDVLSLQQAGEKSPALAGVLSWLIPGLGSYYARNSGHGTRHLVIWGVSLGVLVWGAAETSEDVIDGIFVDEDDIHPALWIGATALVVNTIWAIVTAVTDATDYNETLSLGPLEFAPTVVATGLSERVGFDIRPSATPGVNVQLVRLAF